MQADPTTGRLGLSLYLRITCQSSVRGRKGSKINGLGQGVVPVSRSKVSKQEDPRFRAPKRECSHSFLGWLMGDAGEGRERGRKTSATARFRVVERYPENEDEDSFSGEGGS